MTQGFYEQLGVDPTAPVADIRTAYSRLVAQLQRRRAALVEQGGDPAPLDLSRTQADEAWKVLSDPVRRRRYDAMCALQKDGWTTDPNELWARAAGSLVHPAAAAGAELLRVVTTLRVGALPPSPSRTREGSPARAAEDEPTVTATSPPRRRPALPTDPGSDLDEIDDMSETSDGARVIPLPGRGGAAAEPSLKVVEGSGSAVVVMSPRKRAVSTEDVVRLVDRHGWSGALLKEVRESRGLSLQEIADSTRISLRYLEAIEADAFDALPSATFVRGYVRELARSLSLDEEAAVAGYMKRLS
jgi:curved DNA-binding protein CbpA